MSMKFFTRICPKCNVTIMSYQTLINMINATDTQTECKECRKKRDNNDSAASHKKHFRGCPQCFATLGYTTLADMKSALLKRSLCKRCADKNKTKIKAESYTRNCPVCQDVITYKKEGDMKYSEKLGRKCPQCRTRGKKNVRNCPKCNSELHYYNQKKYALAVKEKEVCQSCKKEKKTTYCKDCKCEIKYREYYWRDNPTHCSSCLKKKRKEFVEINRRRNCPICDKLIVHTNIGNKIFAEKNKSNCTKCAAQQRIQTGKVKGINQVKSSIVNGLTCRSNYEEKYINSLIKNNLPLPINTKYQRTPNGCYVPDFEFLDRFVEIKSSFTYECFHGKYSYNVKASGTKNTKQQINLKWVAANIKPVQLLVLDYKGNILKEEWYTKDGCEVKVNNLESYPYYNK